MSLSADHQKLVREVADKFKDRCKNEAALEAILSRMPEEVLNDDGFKAMVEGKRKEFEKDAAKKSITKQKPTA